MKKQLFFLTLLALALVGCKGDPGRDGMDGLDGRDAHTQVVYIPVKASDWVYSGGDYANFFSVHVDIPELTSTIYQKGILQLYLEFNQGTAYAYKESLQYPRHIQEIAYDENGKPMYDENGNPLYDTYTQTIDYTFGVGFVEIFVTNSDFYYNSATDARDMDFVLVMQWADY